MKPGILGIRLMRRLPVVPTATLYVLAIDLTSPAVLAAAVLLHVITMPATGRLLLMLLGAGALPQSDKAPDLIIVPTAGAYKDENGNWWPSTSTFNRMAHAVAEQERLGVPLVVVGGGEDVAPGEATVAALHFDVRDSDDIIVLAKGDTSDSSAVAITEVAKKHAASRVLLVTHTTHVARMAACLRRHGFVVEAVQPAPHWRMWAQPRYFFPDTSGTILFQRAMYEVLAIIAYLIQGRIHFAHLLPRSPEPRSQLGRKNPSPELDL